MVAVVSSSCLFSDQPLAELSLSLPHRGAYGVGICDDFSTVGVLTVNVLPLSVTLAEGLCQNLTPPDGGELVLAGRAGGTAAVGAGRGVGCRALGGAMSVAAAGALGSVLAGNVGCATWFS